MHLNRAIGKLVKTFPARLLPAICRNTHGQLPCCADRRIGVRWRGFPTSQRPSVRRRFSGFTLHLLAAVGALTPFGPLASLQAQDSFERRELTIPVRDGVKLFAVALVPTSVPRPLPIMLIRTPY